MTKTLDHRITADPPSFTHNDKTYTGELIAKWRIEGRWWADGQDRHYVRLGLPDGRAADLYRTNNGWFIERFHDAA